MTTRDKGADTSARKGANMSKLALLAATTVILAGPAFAAQQPSTADDAPMRAISTQGVNFADQTQVRRFYFRLEAAARLVCDPGSGSQTVVASTDLSCVRRNMDEAVRRIDAPQLTAMLNAAYGPDSNASAYAIDAR
jgi:UrcA family protein